MLDKTKGVLLYVVVGLIAAGLVIGALWAILSGIEDKLQAPTIPATFSAPYDNSTTPTESVVKNVDGV